MPWITGTVSTATIGLVSEAMPVEYRPIAPVVFPGYLSIAGTEYLSKHRVTPEGVIEVYASDASTNTMKNFPQGSTVIFEVNVSYVVG
jgi:hypothetical protein